MQSVAGDDSLTVRVDVTNTGARAGDEVVQLYVQHVSSSVARPIKALAGYQRITVQPGATRTVELKLAGSSLAYWNVERHAWVVEPEAVRLQVGASSADIRLETTINVVNRR